jgi:NAD(P)H-nitrite reductase large subunit
VIVGDSIKQQRVKVITNHTVSVIQGNPDVDGVILDSGEKISCDLVVTAIGVAPRIELTTNTDIKVNRGILVDCYMASSYPDVYSCGDVVEMYDFVAESNRVIPIWPNAYMGGRVAGYNMVGISTQYSGFTAMNSLNYFGIDIVTAGAVVAPGSNYEIISRCNNGIYKKIVLNNDYITGMVFIRDIEKSGMIFSLMRDHINVKNFKQELLNDNFGLAHLPPELWKNRLEAV